MSIDSSLSRDNMSVEMEIGLLQEEKKEGNCIKPGQKLLQDLKSKDKTRVDKR